MFPAELSAAPPPLQHHLLEHAVQGDLRSTSHAELQRIRCVAADGCLVVSGLVPSYYLKQVAKGILQRRLGASWRIDNRLEVVPPPGFPNDRSGVSDE